VAKTDKILKATNRFYLLQPNDAQIGLRNQP